MFSKARLVKVIDFFHRDCTFECSKIEWDLWKEKHARDTSVKTGTSRGQSKTKYQPDCRN
jgi:hypothetical protein